MKKIYWMLLICFLFIAGSSLGVLADEGNLLVELIFEDKAGNTYQTQVCAYENSAYSSGYSYRFTNSSLYIPVEKATTEMKVSVRTYGTAELQVLQCYYDDTVTLTEGEKEFFNFSMKTNVTYDWATYIYLIPYYHTLEIDNLLISVGSKGFHPSTNNYMTVRSNLHVSLPDGEKAKFRVRILNKKGKYVYQSITEDIDGDGLFTFRWNGKASKSRAGVKKGRYVGEGTYTVEFALIYDNGETKETVKKKKKFVISKSAPSSAEGLAKAKDMILYTGDAEIDYMAEKMIKAAGVKTSMSDEEKVRRIYTYMTQNFEHNEGQKTTVKYKLNTKKVKKAVKKFKTATEKKYNKNKLAYSYYYTAISNWTERCMMVRCGVCDDHAEIFVILCNHVGIEAGKCNGYYVNLDGSKHGHAWNYAVVDGRTYYYDVDVEIQNYHGTLNYYWYKKTLEQAKQNHIFYY